MRIRQRGSYDIQAANGDFLQLCTIVDLTVPLGFKKLILYMNYFMLNTGSLILTGFWVLIFFCSIFPSIIGNYIAVEIIHCTHRYGHLRYNFLFTLIISLNFPILCELTFPSCSTAVWFKQMMKFYHSISNGSMHKDINNYLFLFCEIVPILPWQIFFTYKFLVYKKRTITSVIFISQRYGKMFLIVKDVLSTSFCLFVFHHVFHLYGNNSFWLSNKMWHFGT